jgi:hypothetical protein
MNHEKVETNLIPKIMVAAVINEKPVQMAKDCISA